MTTVAAELGPRDRRPDDPRGPGDPVPAAFGPATVRDVQAWCGLTRLREVADGMGPRLRRFRTDDGAELIDVPDGPLPDPDTPAPVRFLAEYDNALLSYADRSRVVTRGRPRPAAGRPRRLDRHAPGRRANAGDLGGPPGRRRHRAHRPASVPLSDADRADVVDEGARLLEFLASGRSHDVRVLDSR